MAANLAIERFASWVRNYHTKKQKKCSVKKKLKKRALTNLDIEKGPDHGYESGN